MEHFESGDAAKGAEMKSSVKVSKSITRKRKAIVMKYLLKVVQDEDARPQRRDRIAMKLMDYLYTKKSRLRPARTKGFNADGTPKGKKAQRRAAAGAEPAKGSKWEGLLQ